MRTDAETTIQTLTHATERDVDLLLVEELIASCDFLVWLARRAGWSGEPADWRVLHSKRRIRSRREIDIHVEVNPVGDDAPVALLVENKLSATEQPDQGESYREEVNLLKGASSFAASLLVCPAQYQTAWPEFAEKFDAVVTYEQVSEFLHRRSALHDGEMQRRLAFRADLLLQAAGKLRRGYTPVPNEIVGSFSKSYIRLLAQLAPEIIPGKSMHGDAPPDESVSMIFDHQKSLAFLDEPVRPRRFAQEFGRNKDYRANYVAVTFARWGVALPAVKKRLLADTAGTGFLFSAKPPTKPRPRPGLVMSLATPPVDNQGNFERQKQKLADGIMAAVRLRKWLLANQPLLHSWRAACETATDVHHGAETS